MTSLVSKLSMTFLARYNKNPQHTNCSGTALSTWQEKIILRHFFLLKIFLICKPLGCCNWASAWILFFNCCRPKNREKNAPGGKKKSFSDFFPFLWADSVSVVESMHQYMLGGKPAEKKIGRKGPGWHQLEHNLPLWQRWQIVSLAALEKALPAGWGRWFFRSAQDWWGHTWSTESCSGLLSAKESQMC